MSGRFALWRPTAVGARGAWATAGLTVFACLVVPGGLLSRSWGGDVYYYEEIGRRIAHGRVPYGDFYLEYPPGAIPAFAVPSLISQAHYFLSFKLLMTLCAAVAAYAGLVTLERLGSDPRARLRAAVVIGLAPIALGPLFLNRFDLWPTALVAISVAAFAAGRPRIAFGLLAVATVAKIYPLAIVPVAAVHVLRERGRDELLRGLAVYVGVALLMVVPFAVYGFGGLGYSFYIQATRDLQVESLGAQVLAAAGRLGAYRTTVVTGDPGSQNLVGRLPDIVGFASSAIEVAAVLAVAWLYRRGRNELQRFMVAVGASVAAFIAFGKVLSPQYLVWLVPLVPLVASGIGAVTSSLLVVALVMTQLEFYDSDHVAHLGTVSWLVLARDVVLVALFGVLAGRLARTQT
jgi:hypothetical protein